MSLMLEKLYIALKDAGASEQAATAASTEVAGYENRLGTIENRLASIEGEMKSLRSELQGDMKSLRSELQGDMKLHRWMLGVLVAGELAIVGMLFRLLAHAS